jgi:hypothetical protein
MFEFASLVPADRRPQRRGRADARSFSHRCTIDDDTGQGLHRGTDKSPQPLETRRKAPTAFLAAMVSGISESAASKESMAASRDYVGATRDLGATSRQHTTAALEDGPSRGDPPRQGWGHQSRVRPGGEQGDQKSRQDSQCVADDVSALNQWRTD